MRVEGTPCGHLLCGIIGGACSLATRRSRGCSPQLRATRDVAPVLFAEVRGLLGAIDPDVPTEEGHAAAVRLAAIVRREALEGRNLMEFAVEDEPDLAPSLARLVRRAGLGPAGG